MECLNLILWKLLPEAIFFYNYLQMRVQIYMVSNKFFVLLLSILFFVLLCNASQISFSLLLSRIMLWRENENMWHAKLRICHARNWSFSYLQPLEEVQCSCAGFQLARCRPPSPSLMKQVYRYLKRRYWMDLYSHPHISVALQAEIESARSSRGVAWMDASDKLLDFRWDESYVSVCARARV